ncbi:FkbO/Hyg5 family chorismatase [Streptomyces coeruleoprunus]|uniref:Phospho-2-dehydro-3-deoxyheptonate aldolase n=1 Tax=Streptomyces coeruleoprunus TaxID=285563 RepID=A0ABV9XL50_9ACTN
MTTTYAPTASFRGLKEAGRVAPGRHVLGIVRYTDEPTSPTTDEGHPTIGIQITKSVEEGFAEVWTTGRPVEAGRAGALCYAHDGDFLFCATRIPESDDYVDVTEAAYSEALELTRTLGYPHIYRIWHYISRINEENASGLEVYREFCVGRARTLERHGIAGDMPAATVIGAHGGGIVLYFLASRSGTQVNIDNPRQVPPYHYPSRYGPKAPNFARATHFAHQGGGEQVFVSGTAGILGHHTMHPDDVEAQCRLALDNIAHVIGTRNLSVHGVGPGCTLDDLRAVKVYVRHQADIARVERICREALSPSVDMVFLNADICRSDLLVELEGIVTRDHVSGPSQPPAWDERPAAQQPQWRDHPAYERVRATLTAAPPLVLPSEIDELRDRLADVAAGEAHLLQMGDCAESFYETTPHHTEAKLGALDALAERLGDLTGRSVVRVGRMGGQYAKPRSAPFEVVDGVELPAFRGHMINAEGASAEARAHDPVRMLWAYHFSDEVQHALRHHRVRTASRSTHPGPWSSHDALVMDYIGPLVRMDQATGGLFLGSTHYPWVGERTKGPEDAHVTLLSQVTNPVACKIGPRSTPESVLRLCEVLDPRREPGRLTLIVRMGADAVDTVLPPIVRAVRAAGHPVIWLCDPMHGNTRRLPSGTKVRHLDDLVTEAVRFRDVLHAHGQHVGGLHLETAAEEVTECVGGPISADDVERRYTTLCDPRLNAEQAAELVDRVFARS